MTEMILVERKLLLSLLEPLRLSRVYSLLGSEFEDQIAEDFKPWKWQGSEMRHADECTAAYRRVMDVLTADSEPVIAGPDKS